MKKALVAVQLVIGIVAALIVGWVFFRARPHAAEDYGIRQELKTAQQQNVELQTQVKQARPDRKQARQYLLQGRQLLLQQKYEEAIGQYNKALELSPDDSYGWSLKGYALFRAGRIPESIDANKKAVELDPGDPLDYINLAKSYCAAKQYEDAKRVLLKDPPADTASAVRSYLRSDGEIRRVCKPILP